MTLFCVIKNRKVKQQFPPTDFVLISDLNTTKETRYQTKEKSKLTKLADNNIELMYESGF